MPTRSDRMEELFDRLAEVFLEKLGDPKCPPATLSAIVKFLQNNEITAIATDDSALGDLRAAIPDELWTKIETQEAS